MTQPAPLGAESYAVDLTPDGSNGSAALVGNGRRACKFILIEYRDIVQMVFGDVSAYKYHANLLHEFCVRNGIASSWVHKPDLLEPLDSSIDVLGGGFLELDRAAKVAIFSGASKAYGACRWHQLETILTASPVFAGMAIRIDR